MASRERKRAERRKRKARATDRPAEIAARYEERNRAAREALEPLAADERPAVVTLGAVISTALALAAPITYALGATVYGTRPAALQVIVTAIVMGAMAVGMWRARYWAVLGFQAVLALLLLTSALRLAVASDLVQVLGNVALIGITGTLFYFMVRAMARIQMPSRG
jgi:hypothetical protein